jgi:hypothetical protein
MRAMIRSTLDWTSLAAISVAIFISANANAAATRDAIQRAITFLAGALKP